MYDAELLQSVQRWPWIYVGAALLHCYHSAGSLELVVGETLLPHTQDYKCFMKSCWLRNSAWIGEGICRVWESLIPGFSSSIDWCWSWNWRCFVWFMTSWPCDVAFYHVSDITWCHDKTGLISCPSDWVITFSMYWLYHHRVIEVETRPDANNKKMQEIAFYLKVCYASLSSVLSLHFPFKMNNFAVATNFN